MRNILALLLFLLIPFTAQSQTRIILGVDGGFDLNSNSYNQVGNPNYTFNQRLDFNTGIVFGLNMKDKNQLILEMKYAKIGYKQGMPASQVDYSVIRIHNLGFNLRYDWRLIKKNKLELFLSPSIKYENNLGATEYTVMSNGQTIDATTYVETDYKTSIYGVGLGVRAKYNVTDYMGITITPDYTYFFQYFYSNSTKRLQRIGLNLGVQFKL